MKTIAILSAAIASLLVPAFAADAVPDVVSVPVFIANPATGLQTPTIVEVPTIVPSSPAGTSILTVYQAVPSVASAPTIVRQVLIPSASSSVAEAVSWDSSPVDVRVDPLTGISVPQSPEVGLRVSVSASIASVEYFFFDDDHAVQSRRFVLDMPTSSVQPSVAWFSSGDAQRRVYIFVLSRS